MLKKLRYNVLYDPVNRGINIHDSTHFAIVNDGAHDFKLMAYYIRPLYQIEQLFAVGFNSIEVIGLDGKKIVGTSKLEKAENDWLHYLYRID